MLVRCERCRAVYVADIANEAGVQCIRCQLVFEARAPVSLGVQGTLGGAAAQALTGSSVSQVKVISATDHSPVGLWAAAIFFVMACGVIAWVARSHAHHRHQHLQSIQAMKEATGEEQLWRDDDASLKGALTSFTGAEAADKANPDYATERALATLLLGLSARDEEQELEARLARVTAQQAAVEDDDDATAALGKQEADLRRQLVDASTRAQGLLADGEKATPTVDSAGANGVPPLPARARLLADALMHKAPTALVIGATWEPTHDAEPTAAAWRAFIAGVAITAQDPKPDDWQAAETDFDLAARLSPRFIRAKRELAHACLMAKVPDVSRAKAALQAVLQLNPHHEEARQALQAIATEAK